MTTQTQTQIATTHEDDYRHEIARANYLHAPEINLGFYVNTLHEAIAHPRVSGAAIAFYARVAFHYAAIVQGSDR